MHRTLVSTKDLSSHLEDPHWVVVDCRFDLADPPSGRRKYDEGHIAEAHYVGLEPDLSGPNTGTSGRHPLPDLADFLQLVSGLGISPSSQVVAYDDRTGLWASRLWWMLRSIGHDAVAVLDGGLAKWMSEGRSTTTARPSPRVPAPPYPAHTWGMSVIVDDVARAADDPTWRLVDARAPERYRGESERLDRVAGHIPGAVNYFFQESLTAEGTFLPPEMVKEKWLRTLAGRSPSSTICYCGSGVTACHTLLAMEHAGLEGGLLYAGSWSEWSSSPSRPVATGAEE